MWLCRLAEAAYLLASSRNQSIGEAYCTDRRRISPRKRFCTVIVGSKIVCNESEPPTIADGARLINLGKRNWSILKNGLAAIVEVPEENIIKGVRLLFTHWQISRQNPRVL
jgi:hypothetical protein